MLGSKEISYGFPGRGAVKSYLIYSGMDSCLFISKRREFSGDFCEAMKAQPVIPIGT